LGARVALLVVLAVVAVLTTPNAEAQVLSPTRVAVDSARFVATPTQLAFGTVNVNVSKQLTVTVKNPGTVPLTISQVSTGDVTLTVNPSSGIIAAGDSLIFTFTLLPTSSGTKAGAVVFSHNAENDPSNSSTILFSASVPAQVFSQNIAPNASSGTVSLGTTGLQIQFSNTGSGGTITVNQVPDTPPPGPVSEAGQIFTPTGGYWVITAPPSNLSGAVFNLTFPNSAGSNGRIAYRPEGSPPGTPWTLVPLSGTQISGNVIIAVGLTHFSEWTVVSPGTPAPTLAALNPASASQGKTLNVIVTGTNFVSGTTFNFGAGITVNSVVISSATQAVVNITVASDAVSGLRTVTVTNPAPGGGTSSLTNAFTVGVLNPTVTAITPNAVDRGASATVSISGTNFASGSTSVSIGGGIMVSSVNVTSSTSLTANVTVPTNTPAGSYHVIVTNTGASSDTLKNAFTARNRAPSVTSINPTSANRGQSLSVTITGANFETGVTTAVGFGADISVTSFSVTSATSLTAQITVSSAAAVGLRDVTVTNAAPGGGTATLAGAFSVGVAAPTVSAITPASGDRGTTVTATITGTNFAAGVTTVSVGGGVIVLRVSIVSPTSLTVDLSIPSTVLAGVYNVTVSNGAAGSATLTGAFTVRNLAPTIASVSPSSGKQGATVAVTIIGTNFETGVTTAVSFGAGITVTSFSVVSSTQITANISLAQNAAPGTRDVTVTNASPGGGTATRTGGFTVEPLTSIEPLPGIVPETYVLHDAFPNPFNPSTTIRYGVPERSDVLIQIYDLAGKLVADLVRLETMAGLFQVKWEAGNASSGTYIVRMIARSLESAKTFSGSSKVVLIR